ncbi:MAG: hypothetical protein Ct9H300mP32_4540 [Verrucomicrobiota bacterium]|nr:MAG: hypothetical protein Ct9H300mP32_4540 [Verrucomicrobiota bacterium]
MANGIGLLSENRKEEGLLLNRSLADNLTLTRFGSVSRFGLVSDATQAAASGEWLVRLDVKASGADQLVGELSGGNQQKFAIGRLLHHNARFPAA